MSAPLHIVTLCHPTLGGSGVLATELALGLGRRGHQVHMLATGHPFRLPKDPPGVTLHTAASPSHPLFETRDDSLTLAAALISLCRDHPVDVIHGHYALPHGPGIMLARRALGPDAPPWALTLHGTFSVKGLISLSSSCRHTHEPNQTSSPLPLPPLSPPSA